MRFATVSLRPPAAAVARPLLALPNPINGRVCCPHRFRVPWCRRSRSSRAPPGASPPPVLYPAHTHLPASSCRRSPCLPMPRTHAGMLPFPTSSGRRFTSALNPARPHTSALGHRRLHYRPRARVRHARLILACSVVPAASLAFLRPRPWPRRVRYLCRASLARVHIRAWRAWSHMLMPVPYHPACDQHQRSSPRSL